MSTVTLRSVQPLDAAGVDRARPEGRPARIDQDEERPRRHRGHTRSGGAEAARAQPEEEMRAVGERHRDRVGGANRVARGQRHLRARHVRRAGRRQLRLCLLLKKTEATRDSRHLDEVHVREELARVARV